MDLLSRMKKKLKVPHKRSRPAPGATGADTGGEGADPTSSLLRPELHVLAGSREGEEPTKSYDEPVRRIDLRNQASQNLSQQAEAKTTVRERGFPGLPL